MEQTLVDTTRHNAVFSSTHFGKARVDIIGCGATGSRIALSLAKLGVINLHLWDFDHVEEHNIANQIFGRGDVGKLKVEALAEIIKVQTGTEPTIHNEKVDGTQPLGEYVFVLTDTMASRKEIWERGIRYRHLIKLMVETRMGANEGRIYCVNPTSLPDIEKWEGTLYGDDVADVSLCGSQITVGPTAELVSGHAVWGFILWVNHLRALASSDEKVKANSTPPPFEYIFGALSRAVSATFIA